MISYDADWLMRIDPRVRFAYHARHRRQWQEPRRQIGDHELVVVMRGSVSFNLDGEARINDESVVAAADAENPFDEHHGEPRGGSGATFLP